jgi:hypothetical protein
LSFEKSQTGFVSSNYWDAEGAITGIGELAGLF